MSADPLLRLEQGDIVALRQEPGGGKPRYTGANDGNFARIKAIQAFYRGQLGPYGYRTGQGSVIFTFIRDHSASYDLIT